MVICVSRSIFVGQRVPRTKLNRFFLLNFELFSFYYVLWVQMIDVRSDGRKERKYGFVAGG